MAVTILGAACGRFAGSTETDLDRNSDYLRAKKAADSGDFRVAAVFYNKVLRTIPDTSRAHLELGVICDEKLNDPIAAIYHYQQFLELEPNSERRQVVEGFIERSKLALAAKLPQPNGVDGNELARLQNEKVALMQENAALKQRLIELERTGTVASNDRGAGAVDTPSPLDSAAIPKIVTQMVTRVVDPPPPQPPPQPPVASRVHLVQKGDTLQSIALRYYGTRSGWEKIYAANRTILPSRDQLKVGQQLVIP